MIKVLFGIAIFFIVIFMIIMILKKFIGFFWQKMHKAVGIDVGTSPYSLPNQARPQLSNEPNVAIPNSFGNSEYELVTQNSKSIKTKHGKITPMPLFTGLTVEKINLMPTEAVIILDRIHDKLSRYYAWQQEHKNEQNQWLTEKQFVLDRLLKQTIPEAVNHYDQLARFNPHQLNQKIHHNMTAGDILIEVLLGVDKQIDELLNELNQQVSQRLATTYHYVKSRVDS